MAIQFNLPGQDRPTIKVIGVGGGGGNAVESMFRTGIKGVEFVVCNTDAQVLDNISVPYKIQLGSYLTNGLGCGAKPEVGRQSALESIDDIRDMLKENTKMVFITAGMGGGTGTGSAPVIAAMAKEMGILTVAIVTTPFRFEGHWRSDIAALGIEELRHAVDSLLVIDNNNLLEICNRNVTAKDAYKMADDVLGNAARGIAEIITVKGQINVDFADVQTIMQDSGTALMGVSAFSGDNRALMAVEEALASPLLNNSDIFGAKGILVNICASPDSLMLNEVQTIMDYVMKAAGTEAKCIFGQVNDPSMGDEVRVTVIATGFEINLGSRQQQPAAQQFSKPTRGLQTHPQQNRNPNLGPTIHAGQRANQSQRPAFGQPPAPQPSLFGNIPVVPPPQANTLPIPAFQQQPEPEAAKHQPEAIFAEAQYEAAPHVPEPLMETRNPQPEAEGPKPPAKRNLPLERKPAQVSADERREKLARTQTDYNFHNQNRLRELENVPAFMRKGLTLDDDTLDNPRSYGRLSVDADGPTRFRLRENNSYLFDNVD